MDSQIRRAISVAALCFVSACSSAGATKRGVVVFNQVFADARNEILLLNILRARDGDPQQFSTVSNVNGSMRPTIGAEATLANLADDLTQVFSPKGTVTLRNPTVTIAPLETKEFREGMMKPVTPEFVDQLLAAGWSSKVVVNLTLAGFLCGSTTRYNSGVDDDVVREFERIADKSTWDIQTASSSMLAPVSLPPDDAQRLLSLSDAERLTFTPVLPSAGDQPGVTRLAVSSKTIRTVVVPAEKGAKMLREGAGAGIMLSLVASADGDAAGTVRIAITEALPAIVVTLPDKAAKDILESGGEGLKFERAEAGNDPVRVQLALKRTGSKAISGLTADGDCPPLLPPEKLILRSPLAMIQYLGKISRIDNPDGSSGTAYFTVRKAGAALPQYALAGTSYRDMLYYVPRLEIVEGKQKPSKSAETFAVLAEIIGFQTKNAELNASKPTITVPAE